MFGAALWLVGAALTVMSGLRFTRALRGLPALPPSTPLERLRILEIIRRSLPMDRSDAAVAGDGHPDQHRSGLRDGRRLVDSDSGGCSSACSRCHRARDPGRGDRGTRLDGAFVARNAARAERFLDRLGDGGRF